MVKQQNKSYGNKKRVYSSEIFTKLVNFSLLITIFAIDTLISANRIEDLFVFNSLNFEAIDPINKIFSIRIDYHYRLLIQIRITDTEPIVTIANILDISNHYQ